MDKINALAKGWLDQSPKKALKGIRQVVDEVVNDLSSSGEMEPEQLKLSKFSYASSTFISQQPRLVKNPD
jgi:hypothetical protein